MKTPRLATITSWITILALALSIGCTREEQAADPLIFGVDLDTVLEAVPGQPVVADEGKPGVFLSITGLEQPARAFEVAPADGEITGGVLLVHGRWGVEALFRDSARALAERGLVVIAPDLYEGVTPSAPLALQELQAGIAEARAVELLKAGLDTLRSDDRLEGRNLLVLAMGANGPYGYLAAQGEEDLGGVLLDSVRLPWTPDWLRGMDCPVELMVGAGHLGFTGTIKQEALDACAEAGVDLTVYEVPGAATDLFDPRAMGYNPAARELAIDRVLELLER